MRTIGIIGGLAYPSTVIYYQRINHLISQRLGGIHCAKLVLVQTDMDEIHHLQQAGNWELVGNILGELANRLQAAGADFYLIACTAVHISVPQIMSQCSLPMLHLVELAAVRIKKAGYRTVGLLASYVTLSHGFFIQHMKKQYNVLVFTPDKDHTNQMTKAHEEELVRGVLTAESKAIFKKAIDVMVEKGAEAIVLGCTEYGLIVNQDDSPLPLLDCVTIHTEAAVEAALADEH